MDLEASIAQTSWNVLFAAIVLLVILTIISLHEKHLTERLKKFLFVSIIAVVILPTLYMIVSTVYLNVTSVSKGPVHWHADFEFWSCGKELELKDPEGALSNKIGTPTLHEHNDKRIHLEGVVVKHDDDSLGKFFRVIGGEITDTSVIIPTTTGPAVLNNGTMCPNGEPGIMQVFVYQTDSEGYYSQHKVEHPAQYEISPYQNVPSGDCIIVEFGAPKEKTDKICRSYKVAEEIDKLKGERKYGN